MKNPFHPSCFWEAGLPGKSGTSTPSCPIIPNSSLLLHYDLRGSAQPPTSSCAWTGKDHFLPSLCSLKLFLTFFYVFIQCSHVAAMFKVERAVWQVSRSGVSNFFIGGHISLAVAFKGPNVILGLYKCDYSLTAKEELGSAAG